MYTWCTKVYFKHVLEVESIQYHILYQDMEQPERRNKSVQNVQGSFH